MDEAVASMHVYRDSLVWRCPLASAAKRASAGYLLVPAVADDCRRYESAELLDRWGVGLVNIDSAALGTLLLDRLMRGRDGSGAADPPGGGAGG